MYCTDVDDVITVDDDDDVPDEGLPCVDSLENVGVSPLPVFRSEVVTSGFLGKL